MKKVFFLTVLLILINQLSYSQWTANISQNTLIATGTGDKAVTKISPTSDGGCYIGWFDSRNSNYDVYLQKLDVNGIPQFATNGLLVSSNPQSSSLVDWDMTTDNDNNAILVFTDTRNGSSINPFAYKISPTGNFLWGANGVSLTDSVNVYQANPKVATTSDGNYIFIWIYASTPRKLCMQKLNSAGVPQWGSTPVRMAGSSGENLDWPSITPSDSGSVIAMWSGYTGNFLNPGNYKIYTQKFSSSNSRLWETPQDTIYNLGRVSGFYTPRLFSDKQNGALYCWRDDRDANNIQSAFIQRLNSFGINQFPPNGSECSTNGTFNHFDPIACYVPQTQETYAFWSESNGGQTSAGGLYGQKFNSSGTRQWTDNGKEYKPLNNNTFTGLTVLNKDTNVIITYNETQFGGVNAIIKAMRTGPSGIPYWNGGIITASNSTGEKLRSVSVLNPLSGMSIIAWCDKRAGNEVFAQNINLDGTFGPPTGLTNINQTAIEYDLKQNFPNPFNPVTKIKFSLKNDGFTTLKVYDITGKEILSEINQYITKGNYEYSFDGSNLTSGIYFYKLTSNNFSQVKKMLLIK